jgi:hypothetical protein
MRKKEIIPYLDIFVRLTYCGKNGSCWEFLHVAHDVGVTWNGKGAQGKANSPVIFFSTKNSSFWTFCWRGENKNMG